MGDGIIPSFDFSYRMFGELSDVIGYNYLVGPEVKSYNIFSGTYTTENDNTKARLQVPAILTLGERYDIHWWNMCNNEMCCSGCCTYFVPFVGVGVGVALGSTLNSSVDAVSGTEGSTTTTDTKYTTLFKPAVVTYGEMGAKIIASKNISVFVDGRMSAMSLLPSKQKITSEVVNGRDITSTLTVSQKEIDFVRDVPATTGSSDQPTKELAEKYPASGFAINCGVTWNFGFGEHEGGALPGGQNPGPGVTEVGQGPGSGGGTQTGQKQGGGEVQGGQKEGGGVTQEKPGTGNTTKEKIKAGAAVKACQDCPPTELTLTSNNDDKDFPGENTKETKTGPYGKSELVKIEILSHKDTCASCKAGQLTCCCRMISLNVKLTFQITYDTAAIKSGVWLNTNKASKEYEHTLKGNSLPEKLKNKEDWKKVDRKSVEVHERQHCSDMKDFAKKIIEDELKKVPVDLCPCVGDGDKDCKAKMEVLCRNLGWNLNNQLKSAMTKLADGENEDYTKGPMEKKAREVQAEDLNNRQK